MKTLYNPATGDVMKIIQSSKGSEDGKSLISTKMKKKTKARILVILLGLDLLLRGTLFMFGSSFGVNDFKNIMDRLGFPEYILGAKGFGKLLMGITFLFSGHFRWRTYAYFALTINLFLAIYSHVSSGEGFADMAPAIMTLIFASIVFYLDYQASTKPTH